MLDLRLYLLQRLSALIMAPLVVGHIATMIYAIQGGLTTTEILARTQGFTLWFGFYGLFVLAASVHGAIGLRTICHEWFKLRGDALTAVTLTLFAGMLFLGMRAVFAVT